MSRTCHGAQQPWAHVRSYVRDATAGRMRDRATAGRMRDRANGDGHAIYIYASTLCALLSCKAATRLQVLSFVWHWEISAAIFGRRIALNYKGIHQFPKRTRRRLSWDSDWSESADFSVSFFPDKAPCIETPRCEDFGWGFEFLSFLSFPIGVFFVGFQLWELVSGTGECSFKPSKASK